MEVIEILDNYPDKEKRRRKWFSLKEAANNMQTKEISNMISSLESKFK